MKQMQPNGKEGKLFSAINGRVLVLIYFKSNEYSITINNYNDKVKMILRSSL